LAPVNANSEVLAVDAVGLDADVSAAVLPLDSGVLVGSEELGDVHTAETAVLEAVAAEALPAKVSEEIATTAPPTIVPRIRFIARQPFGRARPVPPLCV
jgi:hypothetical protein